MATFDLGRVTPIYKGDYSALASYELNDVVLYNGNLYWHVQAAATVGILPTDTTIWKLAFTDDGVRAEIRGYAESANTSAQAASVARTAAEAAAISAQAEAEDAEAAKTAAQTAESNAQGFAQTASEKASQASESAAQAQESVTDAQAEVTRARAEADRAKTYADRAAEVELEIPTKVSELENDAGYLTEHQSLADYVRKDVLYNMLPVDTASGSIASFPDGADDIPLKSLVIGIEPVQDLHGYDSPWPAGGGKNCYNSAETVWANGVLDDNGSPVPSTISHYTQNFTAVNAESAYILSGSVSSPNVQIRIYFYTANKEWISRTSGTNASTCAFTTPTNCSFIRVQVGTAVTSTSDWQIESGSTATNYEPYSNICPISGWTGMTVNANGTEIPISWESEAGTIYGGTLDVLTGVLTVTKGFIQSYNGETLPSTWISDRDNYTEGGSPTTGAEVCYTLAEPITYQLTPHEVKSLLGQNNIYADTGDTTVEYRADTSAYVAKKIAEAISALS